MSAETEPSSEQRNLEGEKQDTNEGSKKGQSDRKPPPEELIQFSCSICRLSELCHYLGKTPPSHKKRLSFKEDTFVMRDPFTPRVEAPHSANRSNWSGCNLLVIGGNCSICSNSVCVDCSTFYSQWVIF